MASIKLLHTAAQSTCSCRQQAHEWVWLWPKKLYLHIWRLNFMYLSCPQVSFFFWFFFSIIKHVKTTLASTTIQKQTVAAFVLSLVVCQSLIKIVPWYQHSVVRFIAKEVIWRIDGLENRIVWECFHLPCSKMQDLLLFSWGKVQTALVNW